MKLTARQIEALENAIEYMEICRMPGIVSDEDMEVIRDLLSEKEKKLRAIYQKSFHPIRKGGILPASVEVSKICHLDGLDLRH